MSPQGVKMGRLTAYNPHIKPGASNYGMSGHWFDTYPDGGEANHGSSSYTQDGYYINQEDVEQDNTNNPLNEASRRGPVHPHQQNKKRPTAKK